MLRIPKTREESKLEAKAEKLIKKILKYEVIDDRKVWIDKKSLTFEEHGIYNISFDSHIYDYDEEGEYLGIRHYTIMVELSKEEFRRVEGDVLATDDLGILLFPVVRKFIDADYVEWDAEKEYRELGLKPRGLYINAKEGAIIDKERLHKQRRKE